MQSALSKHSLLRYALLTHQCFTFSACATVVSCFPSDGRWSTEFSDRISKELFMSANLLRSPWTATQLVKIRKKCTFSHPGTQVRIVKWTTILGLSPCFTPDCPSCLLPASKPKKVANTDRYWVRTLRHPVCHITDWQCVSINWHSQSNLRRNKTIWREGWHNTKKSTLLIWSLWH